MLCVSADVAQEVEHFLGKEEVPGSSPGISSTEKVPNRGFFYIIHIDKYNFQASSIYDLL